MGGSGALIPDVVARPWVQHVLPRRMKRGVAAALLWLGLPCLASEPTLRLDLGGNRGPVLEGFERVAPASGPDERWELADGVVNVVPEHGADPLLDGLLGAALELKLAPGTWHLRVMMGEAEPRERTFASTAPYGVRWDGTVVWQDAPPEDVDAFLASEHYAPAHWPVFRSGETAWDRVVSPHHRWWAVTVEVGGDGLARLESFGRPLQGVILAQSDVAADEAQATADAARRAHYLLHHATASAPEPSFASTHGLARAGWAEDPPEAPPARAAPWVVTMAARERSGGTWWCYGLADEEEVTVEVEGLSELDVALYEVGWLDAVGQPESMLRARPVWMVPRDGAFRGGQGLPVGIAVVLRATDETAPGRHRGRLVVHMGERTHTVPIRVDMLDLQLVPAPAPGGLSVQPNELLTQRLGWGHPRVLSQLDDVLEQLSSRGLEAIALRHGQWPDRYGKPGEPFDGTVLHHTLASWSAKGGRVFLWNDLKFPLRPFAYYRRDVPVLPGPWQRVVSDMMSVLTGWDMDVGVPLYEEEGWRDLSVLPRARRLADRVRELAPPDVKLVANFGHPASWSVASAYDVAKVGAVPPPSRARVATLRSSGADVSVYNLAAGRSGPLVAWAVDATSVIQWNFSPSRADPFHKVKRRTDWFYGVLAPDGETWGSVQLERYAQGITDTRYLATLEDWVAQLEGVQAPPARRAREGARQFLESVRASVDDAISTTQFDGEYLPPRAFEDIRVETTRHLLTLRRWVRP